MLKAIHLIMVTSWGLWGKAIIDRIVNTKYDYALRHPGDEVSIPRRYDMQFVTRVTKWVYTRLKVPSVSDAVTLDGKVFQARGAATKNAQSPIIVRHEDGVTRAQLCMILVYDNWKI